MAGVDCGELGACCPGLILASTGKSRRTAPSSELGVLVGSGSFPPCLQGTSGKAGSRTQEAQQRPWPLGCVSPHCEARGNRGPCSQHLGLCCYLWPSASLHPFTSLTPMCPGQVSASQPRAQDKERQRVNGLQWGHSRGC